MDTKEDTNVRRRRRHDRALKRQVLLECSAPEASVAKVAMTHGLNANLVHKWRREAAAGAVSRAGAFIPVQVAPPAAPIEPPQFIELELQRGITSVRARWPLEAAASCAAWLREVLR